MTLYNLFSFFTMFCSKKLLFLILYNMNRLVQSGHFKNSIDWVLTSVIWIHLYIRLGMSAVFSSDRFSLPFFYLYRN